MSKITDQMDAECNSTVLGHIKALRPWFDPANWDSHTKYLRIEVADELAALLPDMVSAAITLAVTRARQSASGENTTLRTEIKRLQKRVEELEQEATDDGDVERTAG